MAVQLLPTGYVSSRFTYSETVTNGIAYYVNHQPATEAAFHAAWNEIESRPEPAWYSFDAESVERLL